MTTFFSGFSFLIFNSCQTLEKNIWLYGISDFLLLTSIWISRCKLSAIGIVPIVCPRQPTTANGQTDDNDQESTCLADFCQQHCSHRSNYHHTGNANQGQIDQKPIFTHTTFSLQNIQASLIKKAKILVDSIAKKATKRSDTIRINLPIEKTNSFLGYSYS